MANVSGGELPGEVGAASSTDAGDRAAGLKGDGVGPTPRREKGSSRQYSSRYIV